MAARFARFIEREIEKFVEDKDAENKKRSTKVARQVFQEYLKEKNTTEREEKTLLARDSEVLCPSLLFTILFETFNV